MSALVSAVWVFANSAKPFTIDDPFHLIWARTIHPLSGEKAEGIVSWQRFDEKMLAQTAHHPPGWSLLISRVRGAVGDSERTLHWLQWPFAAAFLLGVALLAGAFAVPVWPAFLLAASSPLFLLPAATLMPDMPSAGPAILGVALWMTSAGWGGRVLGLLLLVLGAQMKQPALALFPLLVLGRDLRPVRGRVPWWLAFAGLVLAGFYPPVAPIDPDGNSPFSHLFGVLGRAGGPSLLLPKLGYALAVLSATALAPTAFALSLALAGGADRVKRLGSALGMAVIAIGLLSAIGFWKELRSTGWQTPAVPGNLNTFWFYAAIAVFLAWAWMSFRDGAWRGFRWLGAWLALCVLAFLAVSPFPASRHLVMVLPPLVVAFLGGVAMMERESSRRVAVGLAVAGNLVLGLGLAATDYAFARETRAVAERGLKLSRERGVPLVTTGSWALRHYVEKGGGMAMRRADDRMPAGGILLVPSFTDHRVAPRAVVKRAVRKESWEIRTALPPLLARTVPSPTFASSFHGGHYWFSYAFARNPLERVQVYFIPPEGGKGKRSP